MQMATSPRKEESRKRSHPTVLVKVLCFWAVHPLHSSVCSSVPPDRVGYRDIS